MKNKKTQILFSSAILLVLLLSACGLVGGKSADLVGSAWELANLNGSLPLIGTNITLGFEKDSLGGNGGCNSYGGEYTLKGEKLTLSSVYSTEMYCEAAGIMDQEALYFNLLGKVTSFSIAGEELTLSTSDGETLVFHKLASL